MAITTPAVDTVLHCKSAGVVLTGGKGGIVQEYHGPRAISLVLSRLFDEGCCIRQKYYCLDSRASTSILKCVIIPF